MRRCGSHQPTASSSHVLLILSHLRTVPYSVQGLGGRSLSDLGAMCQEDEPMSHFVSPVVNSRKQSTIDAQRGGQ